MKKTWKILFSTLLCTLLFFIISGCNPHPGQALTQKKFDLFLDSCFKEYAIENAVTLHFHLEHPEKYGINKTQYTSLSEISDEKIQEDMNRQKQYLEKLHAFPAEELTPAQQQTYLIFEEYLKLSLEQGEKYPYYPSILGNNGVINEISIMFSEYYFQDEDDIKIYLKLLTQIPEYFDQLISYEVNRQQNGLKPSNLLLEDTISHMDSFLSSNLKDNIFITTFEDRINDIDFLSEDQKCSYRSNHEMLITQTVLPAYENMMHRLSEELYPSDENERIAQYPEGKEYYKLLLKYNVGTELSPEKCEEILTDMLKNCMLETGALMENNPDLQEEYASAVPAQNDAQTILADLERETLIEFPKIDSISYTLKELPDALSSTSACAFYILPPFDTVKGNLIYLNKLRINQEDYYSTLAHEGFPGHLYQTNYFYKNMSHPLRIFLRNKGYDEGWGTYAQLYSYDSMMFKNKDEQTTKSLQKLYRNNDIFSLCLFSLSDLYVNYEDYSLAQLTKWLDTYGINGTTAKNIYLYVIEKPTSYLSYSIGYYEIVHKLEEEKKKAGFSMKEFHTNILKNGSCPFYILSSF